MAKSADFEEWTGMETAVSSNNSAAVFSGKVVYVYAFDIAYEIRTERISSLLGKPFQEYAIGPSKRNPKYYFFYRPRLVRLDTASVSVNHKPVLSQWDVKVFSIGAVSIEVSIPFEQLTLRELISYHDLVFSDGRTLAQKVRQIAETIFEELKPFCVNPSPALSQSEAYTVFCLNELPRDKTSEQWLRQNQRQVAALLTEETDCEALSEQEAGETVSRYLSYYDRDLVVIDWDAALVVDEGDNLEDVLHIVEAVNVQLAELGAYDKLLDEALQGAYRDLSQRRFRFSRKIQNRLREIRVDLTRFTDELVNITKFFGDWHLAKIHQHLSERFHLEQWRQVVEEKLKTLGELYQLFQEERMSFWMMVLEATIVLLFILDLIFILVGK